MMVNLWKRNERIRVESFEILSELTESVPMVSVTFSQPMIELSSEVENLTVPIETCFEPKYCLTFKIPDTELTILVLVVQCITASRFKNLEHQNSNAHAVFLHWIIL